MTLLGYIVPQEKYFPKNPEKFLGTCVYCRSSYEKKFAMFCDLHTEVTQWSNESIAIKYFDPVKKKMRKYYPDFVIKLNNETWVVEIKPYAQTQQPRTTAKKKRHAMLKENLIYSQNLAKWSAAIAYCDKLGIKFKIITERSLNI
jgi:hypothetical protein